MEGTPSPALSDEDEDEDPDADGEPDIEDHFSTRDLLSSSLHEHRSWTPEPDSQNQTLIAEYGHESSYPLDSSAGGAGEQDGGMQMYEGEDEVEKDELGHAALIDMGTAMEMDGVNEAMGFGDEGILSGEAGLGGYEVVW